MKKKSILLSFRLVCFAVFFSSFSGVLFSQSSAPLTIDSAIREAADFFAERLPLGAKIAVLNFNADDDISSYVIEEFTAFFDNNENFTLIIRDRSELESLEAELRFQASGLVSDETAQSIGKFIGAETIILGSFRTFGNRWRMVVRALKVEDATGQGTRTYTVKKDAVLSSLFTSKMPKTTGEKIGTGALNLILGLGSYLEGDWRGGLTLTSGYAVAAGLVVIEATALDWDSPAVGIPATIGVAVAGVTIVYGFVRPFIYNRNPQAVAFLDNTHIDIVPTSNIGVRLAYFFQF